MLPCYMWSYYYNDNSCYGNLTDCWDLSYISTHILRERVKTISGNALDLGKESFPVRDHGQLGFCELLQVDHDDLFEVRHPVVLEQLHLNLNVRLTLL